MCSRGKVDVVRALLGREDVRVNVPDGDGRTPLSHACAKDHGQVVQLLLGRPDTTFHLVDADGRTALHWACLMQSSACCDQLLRDPRVLSCVGHRSANGSCAFDAVKKEELRVVVCAWARRRIVDVCVGLRGLDLPLLQVLAVVHWDAVHLGYVAFVPRRWLVWEWMTRIKFCQL